MKRLGNVLYILTPESYLFWENDTIAIKIGGEEKVRVPSHTIESIVCFGMNSVSVPLIRSCAERGIGLTFCTENGHFCARIFGPVNGNVLLRKKQYESCGTSVGHEIARNIVCAKILNARIVLLRASREREDTDSFLKNQADILSRYADNVKSSTNIDSLMGIEGQAASIYFSAFEAMQTAQDERMLFRKRTKHPPQNRLNALLSFLYMLCKNDVQSALETVGLDPAVGFLHTLRPGRPSLALDLMEELRSPLCDRIALSLSNKRQITADDFDCNNGQFLMNDKTRRLVIDSWQTRKREDIFHPFMKERMQIGLIPYAQAMLLARHLRGELDGYPPFIWK